MKQALTWKNNGMYQRTVPVIIFLAIALVASAVSAEIAAVDPASIGLNPVKLEEVRQALVRWDPRIGLDDVQVALKSGEPNTLLIRIAYRVRTTNNVFNLVYPFYLERSAP